MQNAINPIDWSECLRLNNNKVHVAIEILELLQQELPALHQKIVHSYQQKNWSDLEFHLHTLHGACCYCGVPNLKQQVVELENLLQAKRLTTIDDLMSQLEQEIQNVLLALKQNKYRT